MTYTERSDKPFPQGAAGGRDKVRTMTWARLVMVLALLFGSAAMAAAEEWVLWQKTWEVYVHVQRFTKSLEVWKRLPTFRTLKTCEQEKEKLWKVQASVCRTEDGCPGVETTDAVPYDYITYTYKKHEDRIIGVQGYIYYGLPDFLDPQQKKG